MDRSSELIDRMRWYLKDNQILSTELWREIYGRDASYFNIRPLAVVRPENISQVRQILTTAREAGVSVTFRTAGTSLSGQTLGNGIICELRTGGWTHCEPRQNGRKVWFEPGLTASQVNTILSRHNTRIGPDPASSDAAMMGGILSNNSSGMTAGVDYNSYHTLSSMEFMLADGKHYNSASAADRNRFKREQRQLCEGLMQIRSEIISDNETLDKIKRKYRIKNVTGYAMNAFVDFDDPMDIFIHVLIGSEGTLAFIISAELDTVKLFSNYSSSLLYFPDVTTAAATAAELGQSGALAVEMMDYASLRSSLGLKSDMSPGTTAMLVDYGADSSEELAEKLSETEQLIKGLKGLEHFGGFTHTVAERARLWQIRDGVFPCVAGARVPGSAVILEDVVSPVESLDRLVEGVQNLFRQYDYDGAIFGHARAGNIHPLITANMNSSRSVDNFRRFMEAFVNHVLKLDGSLKGEHGTGRAIAPFVKLEWGEKIYSLMKRLKKLADPGGMLNPGVIINDDPEAFIRPIKSLDLFGDRMGYGTADRCMECGYCEHVCPSRYVTLTPRQRLQAQRIIARTENKELKKEYSYIGTDTCCTDGSCQIPCPMHINTGIVTDAVRAASNPRIYDKIMSASAPHFDTVETTIRGILRAAVSSEKIVSPYPLIWASDFLHKLYRQTPHWSRNFPLPPKIRYMEVSDPDFIYFPACVTRIFGGSSTGKDDMITVMLRIAGRAGLRMALPHVIDGICCSQIWEHKGDPKGQAIVANHTVETFYEISDHGTIPIVCDTTSCTHTLLSLARQKGLLSEKNIEHYQSLRIIDITQWLQDNVMPRLQVTAPKRNICLHPTCASRLLNVDSIMVEIARKCAENVTIPTDTHCCGAAGDRGFIFPEVARAATRDERKQVSRHAFDGYYSLARTCEISMSDTIGKPYESILYLVDETTSPLL